MPEPSFAKCETLSRAIVKARVEAGLSQQELADYLGKSVGTVKRWEAGEEATLGKTRQARRATAVLVADATGRTNLLGLSEPGSGGFVRLDDDLMRVRNELSQQASELSTELVQTRLDLADLQRRVEHLERVRADTGS